MDVYRADVTLFNSNWRDGLFSVVLFCAVLLVTVLFLFQKAAINNTLISKDYVILCCEINKCVIIVIILKP